MKRNLVPFFLLFLFCSCGHFSVNQKELIDTVLDVPNTEVVYVAISENRVLRTVYTITDFLKPTIVFIHGAPGGSHNFLSYHKDKRLTDKYNILSYDRPGYGYKDHIKAITSLTIQASILNEMIDSLRIEEMCLFSHSFGCYSSGIWGKLSS